MRSTSHGRASMEATTHACGWRRRSSRPSSAAVCGVPRQNPGCDSRSSAMLRAPAASTSAAARASPSGSTPWTTAQAWNGTPPCSKKAASCATRSGPSTASGEGSYRAIQSVPSWVFSATPRPCSASTPRISSLLPSCENCQTHARWLSDGSRAIKGAFKEGWRPACPRRAAGADVRSTARLSAAGSSASAPAAPPSPATRARKPRRSVCRANRRSVGLSARR